MVGAYVLVRELGRGGMGVVWLARDDRLGRSVAIKTLHIGRAGDSDHEKSRVRERALGEARALAAIEHPNIASVFDIVERDGTIFVVMEYVPGESLHERMRRGPLRVNEAISIAAQVAEALASAHASGLLHRDLKPSNIQITSEGVAKVLDFGLSMRSNEVQRGATPAVEPRGGGGGGAETAEWVATTEEKSDEHAGGGSAKRSVVSGTPAYMSPEQLSGEELDARSDLYAFGCVLYEMLTGKAAQRVLSTNGRGIRVEPVWDMAKFDPQPLGPPETVRTLVAGCLRAERHERMRSAADSGVILRGVLDESRGIAARATPELRWKEVVGSRGGVFLLAALAALALAYVVVLPVIVGRIEAAHTWYANSAKMPETTGTREAIEKLAVIGFGGGEDAVKTASALGIEGVKLDQKQSWRRVHAAMVEKFAKAKPKCITLDFTFKPADDPEDTKPLAAAIARARSVYGVPVVVGVGSWNRDEDGMPTGFDPQLLECGARRGVVLVDADEETRLWRIELGLCRPGMTQGNTSLAVETYLASLYPTANTTLSLQGSEVWIDFWRIKGGNAASERVSVAKRLPIEASIVNTVDEGYLSRNPALRSKGYELGDVYAEVTAPFERAMTSPDSLPTYAELSALSEQELASWLGGRIVLIGDTVNDDIPAPDGGTVCGLFSHTAGLGVLTSEVWIQEVSALWFFVWVLFACVLGVICTFFTPRVWQGLLLVGTLAAVAIVCCLWMPRMFGVWLNPISLVAAMLVGAGAGAVAAKWWVRKGIKA